MIIDELFEAPQQCPECGGISFSDLILAEKKDACYHKVKASAKVWPSAYASGRLVQCRKKGAANYGKSKTESVSEGVGNIGDQIKAVYQKIYDQGDDAIEFMYNDSPIFAQYWDEYEGDLDSIIAEVDPQELKVIYSELQSAAEDQGVAEGSKMARADKSAKAPKPKNQQEYNDIEKYRKDLAQSYNKEPNFGIKDDEEENKWWIDYDLDEGVAEGSLEEDKGMTGYNAFKREWRAKHGADAKVPAYDSKEYTSYVYRQNDKKQGVAEVSQQTLQSYRKKASAQKRAADDVVSGDADDETWKKNVSLSAKRRQGIDAANKRLGVAEGFSLKKTNVDKYMEPGDPDEYTQDVNIKDTDYEIINNKTGQVVGTASWTTNDFMGPGALKITMKNGATRWLDIWASEQGNPQSAFNRFVKDPKTAKKYKEQGMAETRRGQIPMTLKPGETDNLEPEDSEGFKKLPAYKQGQQAQQSRGKDLIQQSPYTYQSDQDWAYRNGAFDARQAATSADFAKRGPLTTAEGEQQKGADYRDPKEVDYDDEYDAMVARVKKLAGLGPMKTVYDPNKRVYRNMPTAVQPKK
jgi:hypothetical protein